MSNISNFYSGRTILITGATGYMGKVLLERMLSTLMEFKRIYLFLRHKNGLTPEQRLEHLLSNIIFSFNKIEKCQFKKIHPICGDITKDHLGLTKECKEKIFNEVSIVIHMAANVRFDLSLKDALIQNTLATKHLLELCREVKNLKSVVYVSTTFCNIDIINCEEKVYDIDNIDPYQILSLLGDENELNRIEKKIISPHPNTYTFTKRLAELVVRDMGKELPISIVRPSIVCPAWKEPVPGWVDTLNSLIGISVALSSGITRILYINPDFKPDTVPVDCAANAVIAASWYTTLKRAKDTATPVYNVTILKTHATTWKFVIDEGMKTTRKYPLKKLLWYPRSSATANYVYYFLWSILCQFLPGYILDGLLIACRQKPFIIDIHKRIWNAQKILSYFCLKQFYFETKATEEMFSSLSEEEQNIFYGVLDYKQDARYIKGSYLGAMKYFFKDDGKSQGRYILLNFLFVLDLILQGAVCYTLIWFVLYLFGRTEVLRFGY